MMAWQMLVSFPPSFSVLSGETEHGEGMVWKLDLSCLAGVSIHVWVEVSDQW